MLHDMPAKVKLVTIMMNWCSMLIWPWLFLFCNAHPAQTKMTRLCILGYSNNIKSTLLLIVPITKLSIVTGSPHAL